MFQTGTERVQQQANLWGEKYAMEIVQETRFWSYWQLLYAQTRTCQGKLNI